MLSSASLQLVCSHWQDKIKETASNRLAGELTETTETNHDMYSGMEAAGSSEVATAGQVDGPLICLPESDFIPESLDELVTLLGLEADGSVSRQNNQCTTFAADELWPI